MTEQARKEEIMNALIEVQIERDKLPQIGCACPGPMQGERLCPCRMNRIEGDADALLARFALSALRQCQGTRRDKWHTGDTRCEDTSTKC